MSFLQNNSKSKCKLISVIGYGTFITKGYWKNKQNVEVCVIKDFVRILPHENWFPYILPKSGSTFYALKFDITPNELELLDKYEGVDSGLFKRIKIKTQLKNGNNINAYIYIPTKKTILSQGLSFDLDKNDKWKQKIKKNLEIVKQFPELIS